MMKLSEKYRKMSTEKGSSPEKKVKERTRVKDYERKVPLIAGGGIWMRESKKGNPYLRISIEFDVEALKEYLASIEEADIVTFTVSAFENNYKKKDKEPDFSLVNEFRQHEKSN